MYFDQGVVTYSNKAKMDLLGVSEDLLKKHGAVSEEVAAAMAIAIRRNAQVDYGLATTGIAGPTGGTKEKPVGLVYIALSTRDNVAVKKFLFQGNRFTNKDDTCKEALELLLETISKKKS
jgi:nicotinamide-nucleotide amidase